MEEIFLPNRVKDFGQGRAFFFCFDGQRQWMGFLIAPDRIASFFG